MMCVRSSQSSSPFLHRVGAGEDESRGRRVQLSRTPRAIKLNCLTLVTFPAASKSKGLNCCQAMAANETGLGGGMFSVPSAVVEESEVRDGGLHQWGQQNHTTYSKIKSSILIYYLSGYSKSLSSYHSSSQQEIGPM